MQRNLPECILAKGGKSSFWCQGLTLLFHSRTSHGLKKIFLSLGVIQVEFSLSIKEDQMFASPSISNKPNTIFPQINNHMTISDYSFHSQSCLFFHKDAKSCFQTLLEG